MYNGNEVENKEISVRSKQVLGHWRKTMIMLLTDWGYWKSLLGIECV